ncbi:MAG: indole-3-glycerol-phosphate synthase [Gammaproteobacteria bacterium]|nr:indole-3-glycerol-phosphate synthase [Gammaproteobacteria bacterium]
MAEDFLAAMAASSRLRVEAAKLLLPQSELAASLEDLPAPPALSLSERGFDVIAEMKLRSPALGQLGNATGDSADARIRSYVQGGAAAISVLTEPDRFDGSLDHLRAASALRVVRHSADGRGARVPTMRKDFLVDPYQILEARAAGAGGVLLIVRMLDEHSLSLLCETALAQQLFVLIETFDRVEIERAARLIERYRSASTSLLIGINSRDLASLQVVPDRLENLVSELPTSVPRVAESGVVTTADAARMASVGYDLALIGGALMQAPDPATHLAAMLESARSAVEQRRSSSRS